MDVEKDLQDIIERYQSRRKLRNVVNKYNERRKGRLKAKRELDRADERWITVGAKEENKRTGEPGHKGKHVLIDDEGVVVAGAGGSLTGTKLSGAKSTSGEVKVDPSKTAGEVGESKKGEEAPPPKPKVPKWGDFEQDEDTAKKVEEISQTCKDHVTKTYYGKPEVDFSVVSGLEKKIPEGTVVEINGEPYIRYGTSYPTGFIKAGKNGWDGIISGYSVLEKATDGLKYLGSIDLDKMQPPGVDKEIKFEGNYAEEITKKLWDEAKTGMTCRPSGFASRFDIVKKMDEMPKGTEIEFENGVILKKYQNDWRKKRPGDETFSKAYGTSAYFGTALMNGNVKAIRSNTATIKKSGAEGDYDVGIDNPFAAKYGAKYKPMHDLIAKNKGTESTLWKHFEHRMKPEVKGKKTCYITGTWRICLGGGLKGSKGYHPYEETFHEGGHLIDDRLAEAYTGHKKSESAVFGVYSYGATTEHLSEVYEDGKLRKTMEGEWEEARQKLSEEFSAVAKKEIEKGDKESIKTIYYSGALSKDDYDTATWYYTYAPEDYKEKNKLADLIKLKDANAHSMLASVSGKPWSVYGDVLDMFCMASHGKFGSGHDKGYAAGNKHTATEFFAEAFSAKMCNPESLELITKYFPKSYAVFEEILEWAGKHYDKI